MVLAGVLIALALRLVLAGDWVASIGLSELAYVIEPD
jgi:hypothetical protein